jgi:outer membrane protein TolC
MRPDRLLLVALLASATLSRAVEPVPLDLDAALTLAARHNPGLRLARERVAEREGVVVEVQAVRLPRFDVGAQYREVDEDRIETFGDFPQNDRSYTVDLTARYTLYAGGGPTANVAAAEKAVAAAREEVGAALSGVLLQAGTYYFDGLLARRRAQVQEEAIAVFEKQREWAQRRFQAGAGPELDVLRAEVATANARPPLIRARNDEKVALARLVETIGLDLARRLEQPFALVENWPEAAPAWPLERYFDHAAAGRPEFQALRLQSLASLDRLRAVDATRRPQLGVLAGYGLSGRQFNDGFGSPLEGWSMTAQASWLLWDGGATEGRRRQEESRRAQFDLERLRLDHAVHREVQEAWLACTEAAEIRATAATVVRTATEVLRQAEARFEAGAATQLDVLEAQFELTRARLEQFQADYAANVSLLRLEQASGVLAAPR